MEQVAPQEHWPGALAPLLGALGPRGVWVPGADRLSELVREHAGELGYELTAQAQERTDTVVISGTPRRDFLQDCLRSAAAPGIGGGLGPPVLVVAATGWPHGDALRPAIDALVQAGGWRVRYLEGFGGLALIAPDARLEAGGSLAEIWDELGDGEAARALARDLDRRLARALADEREVRNSLDALLDELDARLGAEEAAARSLSASLARVGTTISAGGQREQLLAHRASTAEALAAAARSELESEREWVAAQARVLARSQSWRLGHRLVRALRLLTLRRDRGTDAVQRIVARMERGLPSGEPGEPPGPAPGERNR